MSKSQSHRIVDNILRDLHGRKGVGDELDTIRSNDPDIYSDLVEDLREIVEFDL